MWWPHRTSPDWPVLRPLEQVKTRKEHVDSSPLATVTVSRHKHSDKDSDDNSDEDSDQPRCPLPLGVAVAGQSGDEPRHVPAAAPSR